MNPSSIRDAVIERLPRTMAVSINEQLARRQLLFPVEQRLLDARIEWLEHLDRAAFDKLLAPVNSIESRMQLPRWSKGETRLTLEHTAIIARSPLYPDWRREVERAFATIDEGASKLRPPATVPRLLICVLPAGLPERPEPWSDFVPGGVRVALEREFREMQPDLLAAIARRTLPPALTPIESTWIVACEAAPFTGLPGTTVVCWDDTDRLRREFLDKLNAMHKTLHAADEAISDLERIDLSAFLPPRLSQDPRVREFIRALLLSGNGSLVMNNSFIQWGASEALRRAQPQVLVAAFGIRDKPKPFSSLVWFEDQTRANPTPDQPDPEGSLLDDAMLSRYVYLTARRMAPYAGHTVTWFAVADRKSALLVTPEERPSWLPKAGKSFSSGNLHDACLSWLQ